MHGTFSKYAPVQYFGGEGFTYYADGRQPDIHAAANNEAAWRAAHNQSDTEGLTTDGGGSVPPYPTRHSVNEQGHVQVEPRQLHHKW